MLRADYIPSNWILLWFILYTVGIVHYNPKLAIGVDIVFNLFTLAAMFYYQAYIQNILYLAIFVFLLKVIPFWTLRNTTLTTNDKYATLGVLFAYIGWILWEGKTKEVFHALHVLMRNKIETPGMKMLQTWFG
jgi:hypothetical protein